MRNHRGVRSSGAHPRASAAALIALFWRRRIKDVFRFVYGTLFPCAVYKLQNGRKND